MDFLTAWQAKALNMIELEGGNAWVATSFIWTWTSAASWVTFMTVSILSWVILRCKARNAESITKGAIGETCDTLCDAAASAGATGLVTRKARVRGFWEEAIRAELGALTTSQVPSFGTFQALVTLRTAAWCTRWVTCPTRSQVTVVPGERENEWFQQCYSLSSHVICSNH